MAKPSVIKTVVTSAAGFYRVILSLGDPPELEYRPIVAWHITTTDDGKTTCGRAWPIAIDWQCDAPDQPYGLRLPDGSITFVEDRTFPAGDEYGAKVHLIVLHEKQMARRKAGEGESEQKG